jgi:hypothetical protein
MAQSTEMQAQQMAKNEVQNTYPDVYRDEADLRNHAFAIAQQQVQDASGQVEGGTFAVQHFADAYIAAYQHAVEERDAGQ